MNLRRLLTFARGPSGLVTLSIALPGDDPPSEFRIFRAGKNESRKGTVIFDEEAAKLVMAEYEAHGVDIMLDLEHLSLDDEARNFDPDARGWCKLAVRNGELWAVNVRWTPDGEARLKEKRQRYISPAFTIDPKTKRVTEVVNIAITAMPATDKLTPLVAARARAANNTHKDKIMNPKLLAALGLPEDADEEAIAAAMAEAMKDPKKMAAMLSAAFDADDKDDAAAQKRKDEEEAEAAKKAKAMKDGEEEGDEKDKAAKRSRRSSVSDELAAEVTRLSRKVNENQVRELLTANRNKVTPALEKWALSKFASDPEGLTDWLKAQPVIANGQRHDEKPKGGGGAGGGTTEVKLTREDVELCKQLGRDPAAFLKHKRALAVERNPMLLNDLTEEG